MTPEQIEAKIKEMETSKQQLIQNVAAHDGYIQCLKEMLKPEEAPAPPEKEKLKVAK